jgi:GntR family transcriptional regulator
VLLQLDFRDRQPLHEQIKEKMKMLIIRGVLQPDEQIPSVRELAQSLTVNPNTIQKAYKNLETEGFIYSVRAKGSFVAPHPQKHAGHHPRRKVLLAELEKIVAELMYLREPKEQLFNVIHAIYAKKEVE